MSKSADIVARSLLNTHHVSVKLGVLKFRVYQPFVKDLARAFAGGKIDVSISGRQKYSMETISKLLFGAHGAKNYSCGTPSGMPPVKRFPPRP